MENRTTEDILKNSKTCAIVGASDSPERYGYELVETMHNAGYKIFPINPKYSDILGLKCYSSLTEVPEIIDVVIIALSPNNTLKAIDVAFETGIKTVWMPPECFSNETIERCKELNLSFVYDVCPIGIIKFSKDLLKN